MSILTKIVAILIGLSLIYVVMKAMKQKQLSAAMALPWLFCGVLIIFLSLFTETVHWFATLFNVSWPPAILVFGAIAIIGFISFKHTKEISILRAQNTELTEQLSILKHELKEQKILPDSNYEDQ